LLAAPQGKEAVVLTPAMVARVREATVRYGVLFESYQVCAWGLLSVD